MLGWVLFGSCSIADLDVGSATIDLRRKKYIKVYILNMDHTNKYIFILIRYIFRVSQKNQNFEKRN